MQLPVEPLPLNLPTSRWETFRSGRIGAWAILLGKFASVQVVVQIFGFASGLLIIRYMSQTEYAYYTIATSLQGTMNLLADMGIGIGVSSLGGKVWQDRFRLGQVLQTAISLRHRLAVAAAAVASPFLLYFLVHQGASLFYALVLLLIVLCSLTAQLSASVLWSVPRLHALIGRLQRLDLTIAAVKLVLIGVCCLVTMNSATALLVGSLIVALPLLVLKPWAREFADLDVPASPAVRSDMIAIVKNQAPNALFYCIQGQITVWLIGMFGKAENVAEIGALGRLALVFSVIASVMSGLVVPRFARCQAASIVRKRFVQIGVGSLFLAFGIVALSLVFTTQCLWLLGSQYSHLHTEFVLCVINAVFAFFIGSIWSLNAARAWIHQSWLYIPATLLTQLVLLPFLDLSTVRDVLLFGILSQIPSLLLNLYMAQRGFRDEFHQSRRV